MPLLVLLLAAQIAWRAAEPLPEASTGKLPAPPPVAVLEAFSLGEPVPLAGLLTLWLQTVDEAPGATTPFAHLDYGRLQAWLSTLLALDPHADAPLLLASHVYSQVPDPAKARRMLEFVRRAFEADPDRRWRWLAHAALVARHRLGDPHLALAYAQQVAQQARGPAVPHWARQMPIFILADLGEVEAARIELGAWLASGSVTDPQERHFLTETLGELERRAADEKSPAPSNTRQPTKASP
ncbi:hypothetical protein [Thiobacter aerophilum]|uniref:Tetratricopeptide repeat protein n=1 Tax=Thiobacter aerophilum TaxID=3121275 RepID=A0ABV0EC63_9BURK